MFPPKAPYIYSNPAGNDMVVRPVQFEKAAFSIRCKTSGSTKEVRLLQSLNLQTFIVYNCASLRFNS